MRRAKSITKAVSMSTKKARYERHQSCAFGDIYSIQVQVGKDHTGRRTRKPPSAATIPRVRLPALIFSAKTLLNHMNCLTAMNEHSILP